MSGVKKATVQRKLKQAMDVLETQIDTLRQTEEERAAIGQRQYVSDLKTVENVSANLPVEIPADIAKFIRNEIAQLAQHRDGISAQMREVRKNAAAFTHQSELAVSDLQHAKQQIGNLKKECQELERRIRNRFDYVDAENSQAADLRSRANRLKSLCGSAKEKRNQASAQMLHTHTLILAVKGKCECYKQEYERIIGLGRNRLRAHEIAEEKRRNATLIRDELESLSASISAENPRKFLPAFSFGISESILKAYEAKQFDSVISAGQNVIDSMKKALAEVQKNRQIWMEAKAEAELAVKNCLAELAVIDRQLVSDFSGLSAEKINAVFAAAEQLEELLLQEDFAAATENSGFILEALRKFANTAEENRQRYEERKMIANVLMQTLCEANYAQPDFCFNVNTDGQEDKLGILYIFAKSPGSLADVKMQIDLQGQVRWEMANVPEGQEGICLATLKDVYSKAGEAGVDFAITDLGRAGNHTEHLPDKEQIRQKVKCYE